MLVLVAHIQAERILVACAWSIVLESSFSMCSGSQVLFETNTKPLLCVCVHLCVCVGGRQGHVAVLNTTAVSGSEMSAFAKVVGPLEPFGLFIEGRSITQTHGPLACKGAEG